MKGKQKLLPLTYVFHYSIKHLFVGQYFMNKLLQITYYLRILFHLYLHIRLCAVRKKGTRNAFPFCILVSLQ